jgi:hypothetical protein
LYQARRDALKASDKDLPHRTKLTGGIRARAERISSSLKEELKVHHCYAIQLFSFSTVT